ncbi:GNAT family N-acetyltransferase [soil metagenome]
MEIQRKETENKGKFYIEENGKQIALRTYKKAGAGKIVIDHTEVDESLQGEGIGNDLVEAGVKFARENDLKIVATCPFAKKVIDETPEFQDVLSA